MTYVLTPGVEREIARTFKPEDVEYVRSRLSETELDWDDIGPAPRIHIAVVWLASGDRKKFDYALEGATYDWRDTLVEAGLARADWPDILRNVASTWPASTSAAPDRALSLRRSFGFP